MPKNHTHKKPATLEERVTILEAHIQNTPTKQQMEDMIRGIVKKEVSESVRETMKEVLSSVGTGTKATLITLATIIGALVVIGGGIKVVLGFIGFQYLK